MNKTKYTCAADSRASLLVVERDMDRLSFITEREGSWTGSAWLSPEDTADLARRLAEHLCLTIAPKPFKRDAKVEDIRKGDLVRVEYARDDVTITRTGVAHSLLSSGWYTVKDEYLRGLNTIATITILSRPEPEPEPELPTTPGAVIKIFLREEWTRIGLGADGYWRGDFPIAGDMELTSDELAEQRGTYWDRFEVVA